MHCHCREGVKGRAANKNPQHTDGSGGGVSWAAPKTTVTGIIRLIMCQKIDLVTMLDWLAQW